MDENEAVPCGMQLPQAWQEMLTDACIERQSIGVSRADVARVHRPGQADAFLKSEVIDAFSELGDEIDRLRWLQAQGLPAPTVIATIEEGGRRWLMMSALPGRDLASSPELAPRQVADLLADALRGLHAVPVANCPFDQRLASRLQAAQARVEAGLVDADDFDEERLGQSPQQVFAELRATQPAHEDLVVSHGDACLPNLIVADGRFTGFIDCGRLGVADRCQDLALAARSLVHNFGDTRWVVPLFQRYGSIPDERRLAFYRLLDEFF
ncbi:APH(3')-II family aminoglycoside O-phosphotransferase [Stenotrophomonas sp. 57]|uniref:APH(3')-II family aminoglycoside O-phosphotransferase n=1 Tax=Stenotrophomonas sp. 57 TaxID=3051119 RepID=UPI00256F17DE|nr:APH(3')-II family aminoglycoside O-phosphotransferase [Stenotrophomonas sp. 57]